MKPSLDAELGDLIHDNGVGEREDVDGSALFHSLVESSGTAPAEISVVRGNRSINPWDALRRSPCMHGCASAQVGGMEFDYSIQVDCYCSASSTRRLSESAD